MALSSEDKRDVKNSFGSKTANAVSRATKDGSAYDRAFKKKVKPIAGKDYKNPAPPRSATSRAAGQYSQ